MADMEKDGVYPAERKGVGEPLGEADVGFLLPTLVCEELRMFHSVQSQTTEREQLLSDSLGERTLED